MVITIHPAQKYEDIKTERENERERDIYSVPKDTLSAFNRTPTPRLKWALRGQSV